MSPEQIRYLLSQKIILIYFKPISIVKQYQGRVMMFLYSYILFVFFSFSGAHIVKKRYCLHFFYQKTRRTRARQKRNSPKNSLTGLLRHRTHLMLLRSILLRFFALWRCNIIWWVLLTYKKSAFNFEVLSRVTRIKWLLFHLSISQIWLAQPGPMRTRVARF